MDPKGRNRGQFAHVEREVYLFNQLKMTCLDKFLTKMSNLIYISLAYFKVFLKSPQSFKLTFASLWLLFNIC